MYLERLVLVFSAPLCQQNIFFELLAYLCAVCARAMKRKPVHRKRPEIFTHQLGNILTSAGTGVRD